MNSETLISEAIPESAQSEINLFKVIKLDKQGPWFAGSDTASSLDIHLRSVSTVTTEEEGPSSKNTEAF